jgi:hypothetical protein
VSDADVIETPDAMFRLPMPAVIVQPALVLNEPESEKVAEPAIVSDTDPANPRATEQDESAVKSEHDAPSVTRAPLTDTPETGIHGEPVRCDTEKSSDMLLEVRLIVPLI